MKLKIEDFVIENGAIKHEHANGTTHGLSGFHCETCDAALRDVYGRLRYGEFIGLQRRKGSN